MNEVKKVSRLRSSQRSKNCQVLIKHAQLKYRLYLFLEPHGQSAFLLICPLLAKLD